MNRSSLGFALAVLLCAMAVPTAHGQSVADVLRYSTPLPATGAQLTGMAGAGGLAGRASYTALHENPAGLGWLPQSVLGGSFTGQFLSDDLRYTSPTHTTSASLSRSSYRLGDVGGAYVFPTSRGALTIGAAFSQTYSFQGGVSYSGRNGANSITDTFLPARGDFTVDSGDLVFFDTGLPLTAFDAGAIEFFSGDYQAGRYPFDQAVAPGRSFGTTIRQAEDLDKTGGLTEGSLGGAWAVAPRVMVGLSLNVTFGSYTFDRFYQEFDVNNSNDASLYNVIRNGRQFFGFDQLNVLERIEANITGFNARAGLSAEVVKGLRAGFTIETPTYQSIEETFGRRIETFFDDGGSLAAGNVAANVFSYRVQTPWRFGAGFTVERGRYLLAADAELVDWSQARLESDDVSFADDNRVLEDLGTTLDVRVGGAVELAPVTLRAGFALQPDPVETGVDRTRRFYSAGVSYALEPNTMLDIGYMRLSSANAYAPYGNAFVPGEDITIDAPEVSQDIRHNRVLVGLRVAF